MAGIIDGSKESAILVCPDMSNNLQCYRCGDSLESLSLPLTRQDLCPSCGNYLHVCRMCRHYDVNVPEQCREDDAEEVTDKEKANFCEWYEPAAGRFDASGKSGAQKAEQQLAALFGETDVDDEQDDNQRAAEDLFR